MMETDTKSERPKSKKDHCPACDSNAVIQDHQSGESICTRCGMVLIQKEMDKKPEWYDKPGEQTGRADTSTGSDITQHDLGLGSKIGNSRDLSPAKRAKMRRLKKWHKRSRATNYQDRSLRQALINLDKLCEDLHLKKAVKEEVSSLFRKAKKGEITPGRDTWTMLSSLIFVVARMRGIPRTEQEIAEVLMERKQMGEKEAYKALRRTRKVLIKNLELDVPRPKPKEYLDRFSTRLDLPKDVRAKAHELCHSAPEKLKSRKASFLVAAGLIYNASRNVEGFKLKIREVTDTLDVGVSSLSKTGKLLRESQGDN